MIVAVSPMVLDIILSLTPLRDSMLPPLSSKVVKYLIDSGVFLSNLRDLSLSKDKYKPFSYLIYGGSVSLGKGFMQEMEVFKPR